jgi:hypothetical protein
MLHLRLDESRHLSLQLDEDSKSAIMSLLDQLRHRTGSDNTAFYVIGLRSEVGGFNSI